MKAEKERKTRYDLETRPEVITFHFSLLQNEGKQKHIAHQTACIGEKPGCLPPTREPFIENVKRTQAALLQSINMNPEISLEEYGWKMDTANKSKAPLP